MPTKIRLLLTSIVIVLAIALWVGRTHMGMVASPLLFFGLSALICGAIWMFPEVKEVVRSNQ